MPNDTNHNQNDISEANFAEAKILAFAYLSAMNEIYLSCNRLRSALNPEPQTVAYGDIVLLPPNEKYSRLTRAIEFLCRLLDASGVPYCPKPCWPTPADYNDMMIPSDYRRTKSWLLNVCSDNPPDKRCNTVHEEVYHNAYDLWCEIENDLSIIYALNDNEDLEEPSSNFLIDCERIEVCADKVKNRINDFFDPDCDVDKADFHAKKTKIELESAKGLAAWKKSIMENDGKSEGNDGEVTILKDGEIENKPVIQSKCVQLFGPAEQPIVNGKRQSRLTKKRYNTIQALIEAGEDGLTKDEIDKKSGHSEARKALYEMMKIPDWPEVIILPGSTGMRYRIR